MEQIVFRVTKEQREKLKKSAKKNYATMSEWIRRYIDEIGEDK